ncbi:MAG: DUF2236 domain-containing protein [Polyangiaceae bacterium]|nr:DUF2236 domain-containing protein [Polyangiaceae bacterium]
MLNRDLLYESDPLADAVVDSLAGLPVKTQWQLFGGFLRGEVPEDGRIAACLNELQVAASEHCSVESLAGLNDAGRVFYRSGLLGGLVLGLRSLVSGYADPRGNKPLTFTGTLESSARRRLAETAKFVTAVTEPGAMRPGANGFNITLHVRLMHAHVRRQLSEHSGWQLANWGVPINQHDMLATTLLFSNVFIEGVELFGVKVTDSERESYQRLWRQIALVLGVREDILPRDFHEAQRLSREVRRGQGAPDDDARTLTRVLLDQPLYEAKSARQREVARRQIAFAEALAWELLDEDVCVGLHLQRPSWSGSSFSLARLSRFGLLPLEALRRGAALDDYVEGIGRNYWQRNLKLGLRGATDLFQLAPGLSGRRAQWS